MRPCYNIHCENGKEVDYLDDDTKIVTDNDCHICNGTGEVEEYCYCAATCESECLCGYDAWYESMESDEQWWIDYQYELDYPEYLEENEIEGE